jgi:uncharacterized membrane protein (UPF0127 family)
VVSQKPPDGAKVAVRNLSRGTTIGSEIRVARSFMARGRGLMMVAELAPDTGLLIDPCSSIHMFFMRIPLDVLYVDRENRVVRAQQAIKPWRIGPVYTRGAAYVIELPVGTIERTSSAVGDQLQIDTTGDQ